MPASSLSRIVKELADVPTRDLHALVSHARAEIARRSADDVPDMDVLIRKAMAELVTESGVGAPVQVASGLIALGGMVQEQGASTSRHKCTLYTVLPDEDATEMWAWDDALETLVHSDTAKVGSTRRSASVHAAMERMVVVRHRMTSDGTRHARTSVNAWRIAVVDDDGNVAIEPLHGYAPVSLPPPHASGGSAERAGRLVRGR